MMTVWISVINRVEWSGRCPGWDVRLKRDKNPNFLGLSNSRIAPYLINGKGSPAERGFSTSQKWQGVEPCDNFSFSEPLAAENNHRYLFVTLFFNNSYFWTRNKYFRFL